MSNYLKQLLIVFFISKKLPIIELAAIHNGTEENKEAVRKSSGEEDEAFQILEYQTQKGTAAAMYKIGIFYYIGLRGITRIKPRHCRSFHRLYIGFLHGLLGPIKEVWSCFCCCYSSRCSAYCSCHKNPVSIQKRHTHTQIEQTWLLPQLPPSLWPNVPMLQRLQELSASI